MYDTQTIQVPLDVRSSDFSMWPYFSSWRDASCINKDVIILRYRKDLGYLSLANYDNTINVNLVPDFLNHFQSIITGVMMFGMAISDDGQFIAVLRELDQIEVSISKP